MNLIAEDNYCVGLAYGKATKSDFSEIIFGNIQGHENNLYVTTIDGGYKIVSDFANLPIDVYVKSGLGYFSENDLKADTIEGILYLKVYYKLDFLSNRVRFGLGEGVSYTDNILYTEWLEASEEDDANSKFLNYLDVSIDFDIGKLVSFRPLLNTYIGSTLKHRSGILGLINDVKKGGSNYIMFSVEKNF